MRKIISIIESDNSMIGNIDKKTQSNEIAKRAKKKQISRRFKIGENEKEIIKIIGLGALVITSLAIPNLPIVLKSIYDERGSSGLREMLKRLNYKKIVRLGGDEVKLTSKGLRLFQNIKLGEIVIAKPNKWDGVWHLVSYDVPNEFNKERDFFRAHLKRMGFYQIQKSLWVYPYGCKEEIAIIAEKLDIAEYVVVMNTDYLPNEEKMESYFELI